MTGLREAITASDAKLKEDLVSVRLEAKDSQEQSRQREAQAIVDIQNLVVGLGTRPQTTVEENCPQMLAAAEMRRANEGL
jgi:hypothetical protein